MSMPMWGAPPAAAGADAYFAPITTAKQLKRVLSRGEPAFVLVHASWCGHCQSFIEEVARSSPRGRIPRCHAVESEHLEGMDLSTIMASPADKPDAPSVPVQVEGFPSALYVGSDGVVLFGTGGGNVRSLFGMMKSG